MMHKKEKSAPHAAQHQFSSTNNSSPSSSPSSYSSSSSSSPSSSHSSSSPPSSSSSTKSFFKPVLRLDHSMHTGFDDGFEPLQSLDLEKCRDFDQLAAAMSKTAFGGRALGEAVDVFYTMLTDPDCFVTLTLSGAMTPAKMGLLICDMIDLGMVHAVISTGALMTHGLVEAQGMFHFKYKPGQMNDNELYEKGYDRIYDVLELEKNLDDTEHIFRLIMKTVPSDEILCSYKILRACGKWLSENTKGRGILKSAYEKNVPVYVPAFTDCEMGLDFGILNRRRIRNGLRRYQFNSYLDLDHFAEIIRIQKTCGVFTIGGGVPRNWAQQAAPYLDIMHKRAENECSECEGKGCPSCGNRGYLSESAQGINRYKYGIRICPEPVHWGGLSGCTYSEGVTWGKFVPREEGGRWSEVLIDATVAWPLLLKAVIERLRKNNKLSFLKEKQKRMQASMKKADELVSKMYTSSN